MNRLFISFTLSFLLLATGCDLYEQDSYKQYYVIESYLIANASLPEVKVSTTLPIGETYSFQKAALSNATVTIQKLAEDGSVQQTYSYQLHKAGIYLPEDSATVLPEHRYRLKVTFPNGDVVHAETFVPGNVEVINNVADSIIYQAPNQLKAVITPSYYPGRQSYFIFSMIVASTPSYDRFTPFYADLFDKDEDQLSDFFITSSPILNEDFYGQNPDGTLTIRLPWVAVAFYGKNKIVLNAIDDNMYDFLRSQSVQTGGSTLPPGQIQNIMYHVEGGIGIFGSMASDTIKVFIKRGK